MTSGCFKAAVDGLWAVLRLLRAENSRPQVFPFDTHAFIKIERKGGFGATFSARKVCNLFSKKRKQSPDQDLDDP